MPEYPKVVFQFRAAPGMFFFFFPYSTDAPVYHFPAVTIGMIAANVVAFGLMVAHPESAAALLLAHGDGLHPLQWVTSNFMHGGILHLVFNMVNLWVFGLIVEGKIGWWRMLVLYLGIGVVQNALEQVLMLGASEGGSLGASGIIYGLMAISLLWAPKNDVNCVFVVIVFFFVRAAHFDVQVMMLTGFMIGLDFCRLVFDQFQMSSMLLHSMGALVGGAAGLWMLKTGRVDCENWDLFSVQAGKHEMTEEELQALTEKDPEYQEQKRQEALEARRGTLNKIRFLVKAGNPREAFAHYRRVAPKFDNWRLPEADLREMVTAFHKEGQWSDSIPAMVELLGQGPSDEANVRLKLAQILLQAEGRPAQAWNVFSKIDAGTLNPKQREFHGKLKRLIVKAKEENPYDYVNADW